MATKKAATKYTRPTTKAPVRNSSVRKSSSGNSHTKSTGIFDYFRFGESYTSLILGMVVVIIATILLVAFFKNTDIAGTLNPKQDISSTNTSLKADKGTYTVKEGDTLWSISESELKDGYRWSEIAKANNLNAPYSIEKGTKLELPAENKTALNTQNEEEEQQGSAASPTVSPTIKVSPTVASSPTIATSPTKAQEVPTNTMSQAPPVDQQGKITGTTYTVRGGDYLWDIALRAYGDGYKWVDIARANNLQNPDIIHNGNNLKLPR